MEIYIHGAKIIIGQLGDGTTVNKDNPTQIMEGIKFKKIAVGYRSNLAIDENGNLYTWGCGDTSGNLGDGLTWAHNQNTPYQLMSGTKFKEIACANAGGMAIDENGNLYCWGSMVGNYYPNMSYNPVQIMEGKKFKEIALSYYSRFALEENGVLWAWGTNYNGSIGNGKTSGTIWEPMQIF